MGNAQHRNMAIAYFYLHLAQRLIGGKIQPFTYRYGDIENPELDLLVEVKARNNEHQFSIYVEQLERFLGALFPFGTCLLMLFGYRNHFKRAHVDEKGLRISRVAHTERQLYRILAKRTMVLFLLDAKKVMRLHTNREKDKSWRRNDQPAEIISLNRSSLQKLTLNRARIELIFWGSKISFDCFFSVSRSVFKRILRHMSKSRGLQRLQSISVKLR